MGLKVLITDSALADLKEIVEFVAQDNREAAIRLGEKLIAHALSLENMPQRFGFHDEQRGIRKMTLPPSHLLHLRRSGVCCEHPSLLARSATFSRVPGLAGVP